jgi:hypothetical protein
MAHSNLLRVVSLPFLHQLRALMLALVTLLGGPSVVLAQGNPHGILLTGIDHTTPTSTLATHLQRARDAGAGWVRIDLMWYSVQWNPGEWNWQHFDRVFQEAGNRGLQVLPVLWGTPNWAAVAGGFSYGVPNMGAWEAFVFAAASRYRGRVPMWEIWNEPDLSYFWRGTPGQYAETLARAYQQIKRADPNASVLLGGLAQGGGANSVFLQQILSDPVNPAGYFFDYHNVHSNFRYMDWIVSQIQNNRAILSSYGFPKPVVVTEASYTSNPSYQSLVGYQDGEAGQARYLSDALRTIVGQGVPVAIWASLRDGATVDPYAQSGLARTDLSAKPSFFAFQQVAQQAPATCSTGQYRAEYYGNTSLSGGPAFTRCESAINYDWSVGGPGNGIAADNFSVRWVGTFGFSAGTYTFTATADDAIRLWIDGGLVIDAWRDQSPTTYRATRSLSAGNHEVKVEYYERTGGAVARVNWSLASTASCPGGQYLAEYYGNVDLSGTPVVTQCEANIDRMWGSGSPVGGVGADNFSVRWTGQVYFPGGDAIFTTIADDGVRVWLDGALLLDAWRDQSASTYQVTRYVPAGTHGIRVEYYDRTGDAVARVGWQVPSSACGVGQYLAEYHDNSVLGGSPRFVRCETAIDYAWGTGGPGNGLGSDNFSARWSGRFNFAGGSTTFTATADDGIRVWVDGSLIIDAWRDQSATTYQATRALSAGQHDVKVEYYDRGLDARVRVSW